MSDKNITRIKKEDFLNIIGASSVFFSLGKPPKNHSVHVLTESFVLNERHEKFFTQKTEKLSIDLAKDLSIDNQRDKESYIKHDLKLFATQTKLKKHCENRIEKSELNQNTKNMVKELYSFFDNNSVDNYVKLKVHGVKVVPEFIHLNNPIINSLEDLENLSKIKKIYIVDNLIEAKFKEIDINQDSFNFSFDIEFFKNEVVVNLHIKLDIFGENYNLNDCRQTKDGYVLKGDNPIYTSKKDLSSAIQKTLADASNLWRKKLSSNGEVDF